MKKKSFFERLAGNLRFDDVDEEAEDEVRPSKPLAVAKQTEKREVPIEIQEEEPEVRPSRAQQKEEIVGELPVDVYETPSEIIIQTLIAGVLPEHLSINITRDSVTVSGKREENKSITKEHYHMRELYWGAFARIVELPAEVDIDGAEAIERHGMLIIKLPRLDKARKATLKVKSI